MQQSIACVQLFVLSGSDDGSVHIWKARASEKLGVTNTCERAATKHRDSLKDKRKPDPEVGKIQRNHHIPRSAHNAASLKRTMLDVRRVKEERSRHKHTRAGESKPKASDAYLKYLRRGVLVSAPSTAGSGFTMLTSVSAVKAPYTVHICLGTPVRCEGAPCKYDKQ